MSRKIKIIFCWVAGVLLGIYLLITVLLNTPLVQHKTASLVANSLSSRLGTEVSIGRLHVGLLNRIIIEDIKVNDQTGMEMLKVSRLSGRYNIRTLFKGKISIPNAQLFGATLRLVKPAPEAKTNFQFVLDAFTSKDSTAASSDIDLRINSLLIRRGRVSYDEPYQEETPEKLNLHHLELQNIAANISLKAFNNDSINANIRKLNVEDAISGFKLQDSSLKMVGNRHGLSIGNISIGFPNSHLMLDTIAVRYNDFEAFSNYANDVNFSVWLQPSTVLPSDFAPLLPALKSFTEPVTIEMKSSGTLNQLDLPLLSIASGGHLDLRGSFNFKNLTHPDSMFIRGDIARANADQHGLTQLYKEITGGSDPLPSIIRQLGNISFSGDVSGYLSNLNTYGMLNTDIGDLQGDVRLQRIGKTRSFKYNGNVQTIDFELGKLLDNAKLGKATFDVELDGINHPKSYPNLTMKGLVSTLEYSGYTYENINMDGKLEKGGFDGHVSINDENAAIELNGSFNQALKEPTYNLLLEVRKIRPQDLMLSSDYEDSEASLKVKADFKGKDLDRMIGRISVDSFRFDMQGKHHFIDNLSIMARQLDEKNKQITINSKELIGRIEGDYSYKTLPISIMNLMKKYIPAFVQQEQKKEIKTENNFSFEVNIYDTDMLSALLRKPVEIYTQSSLKGFFSDSDHRIRIEGYFPNLRYGDKLIESGVLSCDNSADKLHASLRYSQRGKNGGMSYSADATAHHDSIHAILNWGNDGMSTYSGKLSAIANFQRVLPAENKGNKNAKSALRTLISIQPTDIIMNDTLWNIHPSDIMIDGEKIYVSDFKFTHDDRHLLINGVISKEEQDTLRLDLNEINIDYIFDMADLGVNFQGEATGPAYASHILKEPYLNADLSIRNFGTFYHTIGDARIHGEWHNDVSGILLDAQIKEQNLANTHVQGYIYPLKPISSLDLQIDADRTNLKFLQYFMDDITPDFQGRVSGDVHLYGKFKKLTMAGKVMGDASMKIDVLNTSFSLKDSILVTPDGLTFRNNRVYDTQGHEGRMDGELRYDHFANMRYNFRVRMNDMLIMNTQSSPDFSFYGTIYGTGNATIWGTPNDGLNVDLAVSTNQNSTFTYIKDYVNTATGNQFVKFVDKTPHRLLNDSIMLTSLEPFRQVFTEESDLSDIHLNILVDVTPQAVMRIVMDPVSGDYISTRGSGNIRAEFYNKGDFKMFGTYGMNQGVYKFSIQELIRKDFNIKENSSIVFSGNPEEANLDIRTSYTVNSASLNDLIPNASSYVDKTNVRVNCLMNIGGQLTSPTIKLELELPQENDEVQALVRNYIPTDEQMYMQILYLLGIGKFYTPENVDVTQNSDMMSSMVSSTISGQLNNALSHIINSSNWNLGTNFSTGENGWNDMDVEGILSGQLLNNRLLINGNFGYRENQLSNTNFVGDFDAELLLNKSGEIRLKAYNETNNRYYSRTNLTTQGIGIIFRKDFNDWKDIFFWNRWRQKALEHQRLRSLQKSETATEEEEVKPEAQSKREHDTENNFIEYNNKNE